MLYILLSCANQVNWVSSQRIRYGYRVKIYFPTSFTTTIDHIVTHFKKLSHLLWTQISLIQVTFKVTLTVTLSGTEFQRFEHGTCNHRQLSRTHSTLLRNRWGQSSPQKWHPVHTSPKVVSWVHYNPRRAGEQGLRMTLELTVESMVPVDVAALAVVDHVWPAPVHWGEASYTNSWFYQDQ